MNILEAKKQIKNTVVSYLTKDETGDYVISIEKQRPIFMVGAPGIGKTAIMKQIAEELKINLVTYSMTHHTRQSAIGLPIIEDKIYNNKTYKVSEYSMSEIIAAVYDVIENTGIKEGILFLDEINCVSETLAPAMLQFLQYKIFGNNAIPEGFIIVTAGNPPEYNNSVKEFDMATLDRLKKICVDEEYDVWRKYSINNGIHLSILTYLDQKPDHFYSIKTSSNGREFITARGWSDLSDILKLYEMNNFEIDYSLIIQYINDDSIARDFSIYYELFNKYKVTYSIEDISLGKYTKETIAKIKNSLLDERIVLIQLLLDGLINKMISINYLDLTLKLFVENLRPIIKDNLTITSIELIKNEINITLDKGLKSKSLTNEDYKTNKKCLVLIEELLLETGASIEKDRLKKFINKKQLEIEKEADDCSNRLEKVFKFIEEAFGKDNEMLIFVTDLTSNKYSNNFISNYGSKEYFENNDDVLFYQKEIKLVKEIEKLNMEGL